MDPLVSPSRVEYFDFDDSDFFEMTNQTDLFGDGGDNIVVSGNKTEGVMNVSGDYLPSGRNNSGDTTQMYLVSDVYQVKTLTLCLSVSFSLSLSVSPWLSLFSLFQSLLPSLSHFISLSVSLSLFVSVSLCLSL